MAKPKREEQPAVDERDAPRQESDYGLVEAEREGRDLARRILNEWAKELAKPKVRKRA